MQASFRTKRFALSLTRNPKVSYFIFEPPVRHPTPVSTPTDHLSDGPLKSLSPKSAKNADRSHSRPATLNEKSATVRRWQSPRQGVSPSRKKLAGPSCKTPFVTKRPTREAFSGRFYGNT